MLASRSLSMNPSIFSIWGLRDFAIARYSSNRCSRGRTSKITTNMVASVLLDAPAAVDLGLAEPALRRRRCVVRATRLVHDDANVGRRRFEPGRVRKHGSRVAVARLLVLANGVGGELVVLAGEFARLAAMDQPHDMHGGDAAEVAELVQVRILLHLRRQVVP